MNAAVPIPAVSVIVPAFDAGATLRSCLASIFANRDASFEVIVVDDASRDDTLSIALEFPCRVIHLDANIRAANGRNLGAEFARAELLIFFDADQLMEPDTIRRFLDEFAADPAVAAVVASFRHDTPIAGFFTRFKNLRHHHVHQVARRVGATLASGFMAIRKSVFAAEGGFEPAFGTSSIEDIALGITLARKGHKIVFSPDNQVTHLKSYTLGELLLSDVRDRAIPWTELMLRERIWRDDLNTSSGNVLAVALSWLLPLAPFLAMPYGWMLAGLCLAGIWLVSAGLLRRAWRHFGFSFLLGSAAFLPLMYFAHGLGLVLGLANYLLGATAIRQERRRAPYRVFQGGDQGNAASPERADRDLAGVGP
ncbi:MAG: glycosyltransferase family 2 protein [Planctomycetes bacterium]|nr:glycosyltransferase family 2 protein [Planctomycetota bacterium]